jgi:hypothetical protein
MIKSASIMIIMRTLTSRSTRDFVGRKRSLSVVLAAVSFLRVSQVPDPWFL